MTERSDHGAPRPLPREWLPDQLAREEAPVWDARSQRIMEAADPELRRLWNRRSAPVATWWSVMGLWWKPAAALAAAATAFLLLTGGPADLAEPPSGSIPLDLVASAGDPVTLWGAFGVQAHPVLAQIAIREQADVTGQDAPPTIGEEVNR